ncbi:MAG: YceI family protein [Bacteroidota bacterium]
MKKAHNWLFLLAFTLFIAACQNNDNASSSGEALEVDKASFSGSADFQVDTRMSIVGWKGTQNVSNKAHTGKLSLSDGTLYVKDGELVGGKVTIDMNSLTVTDLEGEYKGKLEGHLKSDDFFGVTTYPAATFEIATITPVDTISGATHVIAGNLTMRDITKSISFPSQVRIEDKAVSATTLPFQINRTEWEVNYNAGFLGTVKDKIIEDEVSLNLKVRATLPE